MTSGGEDIELLELLASFSRKPRAFVYAAFPWGEPGELEKRSGPEKWQDDLLSYMEGKLLDSLALPEQVLSEALQIATKSGHDIGKSALVCWIILWAMSTREDTKGVVTANTEKQLRLKLWSELAKWHRLFLGRQFFKVTATSIQASDPDREKEWRIDAIPWSEDNPEAFAGLHNYGKRILVIFDEASGIVEKIWETIDGVMNEMHTELIWLVTGNPTRNTGRFRECFDRDGQGQFWKTFSVDSREVSFTNKERIERQIKLWGIESDYIKVRWLGEFPSASAAQLIPSDSITAAMHREPVKLYGEARIMMVDVARYGDDESVIAFREGKDARSIPMRRYRNLNNVELATEVANLMGVYAPDAVLVDGGGVGGGVIDFLRHLGHHPIEVQFGASASVPLGGEIAANKRAEMYLSLRTWLREGGCIENSADLARQLISVEYTHSKAKNMRDAIILTPKEEMEDSPDLADAIAISFAFPISKKTFRRTVAATQDYDPLSQAAFSAAVAEESMVH